MKNFRLDRAAAGYFQALSAIMCFDLDQAELSGVTVTRVVFTPDLKLAKIYFTTDRGRESEPEIQKAFAQVKKFLRKRLAEEVPLKFVPDLKFYYDESAEERQKLDELFRKIEGERHAQSQKD